MWCLKSGSSPLQGEETSGGKNDKAEENGAKTERAIADLGWWWGWGGGQTHLKKKKKQKLKKVSMTPHLNPVSEEKKTSLNKAAKFNTGTWEHCTSGRQREGRWLLSWDRREEEDVGAASPSLQLGLLLPSTYWFTVWTNIWHQSLPSIQRVTMH